MLNFKRPYSLIARIYDNMMTGESIISKTFRHTLWGVPSQKPVINRILSHIPDSGALDVLDVPSGTLCLTLSKYLSIPEAKVTALDFNIEMLKVARKRLDRIGVNNITLRQGDVMDLPFMNNAFDIVVCLNGLHVFPDRDKAIGEITRCLRPDGILILSNYVKGLRCFSDIIASFYASAGLIRKKADPVEATLSALTPYYDVIYLHTEGSILSLVAKKR